MKTFLVVAKYQSFSKAAYELDINVATVSKHVKSLEAHLKVQLFERTTKRVQLNDAGKLYQQQAKEILSQLKQAECLLHSAKGVLESRLNIAIPPMRARERQARGEYSEVGSDF
ncbi:hypothetical protein BGC07_13545 [Piscirickettsia litoralis]|uniref:HTH lysR-type domain-containing protein n=2 Tax=Piscirickettsia litoralis TaxID=1891921 RepID=A0ABX3A542_9GAMM|nr:hypothetical protein BGC07_13545 [Piscirickettsia litoralis]